MKGTKTGGTDGSKISFRFRAPQKWRGLKLKDEVLRGLQLVDLEHPKNEGD